MDWLKQIAPTIATAMGGPLAGMAVSAISKAIGVDPDKVGDLISSYNPQLDAANTCGYSHTGLFWHYGDDVHWQSGQRQPCYLDDAWLTRDCVDGNNRVLFWIICWLSSQDRFAF